MQRDKSLSKLGKGSNDRWDSVWWMGKWWAISWSPRELSSKSNHDWILNQILRSQVSDFLLLRSVGLGLWEELDHLLSSELSDISDVVKCFNLLEVHEIVDHPQVVVVVHSNVQVFHRLSSCSALWHGSIHLEFCLHELCILLLHFSNNIRGVDVGSVSVPIDFLETSSTLRCSVVVIKNWWELRVLFSWLIVIGSCSESI